MSSKYTVGHYDVHNYGINPFDTILDKFFDSTFPELKKSFPISFQGAAFPKIDVKDYKDKVVIEADIHGYEKDKVRVEFDSKNDILSIIGNISANSDGKKEDFTYVRREIKKSSFQRSFSLGKELDGGSIKAENSDGFVTVTIKKVNPESHVRRLL